MSDWANLSIESIASVKTGPFGAQLHQRDYVKEYGTPIITVEHLSEKGLMHKNIPLVSDADTNRLSQYILKTNDVVFSRVGSVDRCSIVSENENGWLFSGRLLRIRPKENQVFSPYLVQFFQTKKFKHHMRSVAVGGTMPSLNTEILKKVCVSLPPLPKQKSIANTLQTWDTAIEKTEALIAAKERQFDWLCGSLLEKIISENKNNGALLSDIFEFKKGVGISKADTKSNGKNKCVLYGQLYTTYEEVINEVESSTDISQGIRSKNGDILIPASTTTSAIDLANATTILENNVLLGGDINILRPKTDAIDSQFMAYYLTHYKKNDLAKLAQGITIIHLYGRDIQHINISIPQIDKQRKLAKLLNFSRKEINLLKKRAEQYRTQKQGLMQKLLTGQWRTKA